jgi:hypothetical protein
MIQDNDNEPVIKAKEEVKPPEIVIQEQNYQNFMLLRQLLAQQGIILAILGKICQSVNLDLSDIVKEMEAEVKRNERTR